MQTVESFLFRKKQQAAFVTGIQQTLLKTFSHAINGNGVIAIFVKRTDIDLNSIGNMYAFFVTGQEGLTTARQTALVSRVQ